MSKLTYDKTSNETTRIIQRLYETSGCFCEDDEKSTNFIKAFEILIRECPEMTQYIAESIHYVILKEDMIFDKIKQLKKYGLPQEKINQIAYEDFILQKAENTYINKPKIIYIADMNKKLNKFLGLKNSKIYYLKDSLHSHKNYEWENFSIDEKIMFDYSYILTFLPCWFEKSSFDGVFIDETNTQFIFYKENALTIKSKKFGEEPKIWKGMIPLFYALKDENNLIIYDKRIVKKEIFFKKITNYTIKTITDFTNKSLIKSTLNTFKSILTTNERANNAKPSVK